MGLQHIVVILVVTACSGYAVWALIPAALRRTMAQHLLRLPHPTVFNRILQNATQSSAGCGGCGGCDKIAGDAKAVRHAAPATQVLQFHPPRKG